MTKALVCLVGSLLTSTAVAADSWNSHLNRFGENFFYARMDLNREGSVLTGTLNDLKLKGTWEGDHLVFTATRPNGKEWGKFEGRVQGEEITGTVKLDDEDVSWIAHREQSFTGPPKTHEFEPAVFHRFFSGSIAPALHIHPGDTIRTTTVDAGGKDAKGVRRSMGGNPETGPFFVDGAMPGDTLAIRFLRIRLNRDSAGSGDRIVSSALRPGYLRDARFDDNFSSDWKLDREAGLATPAKPTDRMKDFRVRLRPMLGCVGVAPPANQSFRSGWLGPWGGNMDYSGLRENVTVYLPVFQEGAILFVGDGHALQGDGELTGDALETSMDVEFKVDLIRGKSTQGPRFEDDEFLMASGIAGSLPDALQEATTELARWLERDYKLSPNETALVLGTSIRYDIAEVVDPQVHIVAKVAKSVLVPLKE